MTLPRGYAFEGKGDGRRMVAVTMPPDKYFDDPPETEDSPVIPPSTDRGQEIVVAMLEIIDVPLDKLILHRAALRRIMGKDRRSLRIIAKEIGVSHPTLLRKMDSIKRKFPKGSVPV